MMYKYSCIGGFFTIIIKSKATEYATVCSEAQYSTCYGRGDTLASGFVGQFDSPVID
jgi:hypothetical protein